MCRHSSTMFARIPRPLIRPSWKTLQQCKGVLVASLLTFSGLVLVDDVILDNTHPDSEEAEYWEDEEDSNAEDYYQNDYPDEDEYVWERGCSDGSSDSDDEEDEGKARYGDDGNCDSDDLGWLDPDAMQSTGLSNSAGRFVLSILGGSKDDLAGSIAPSNSGRRINYTVDDDDSDD